MISKKTRILWLEKIRESLEDNLTKEEYEEVCDNIATLSHYVNKTKAPSLQRWNGQSWVDE